MKNLPLFRVCASIVLPVVPLMVFAAGNARKAIPPMAAQVEIMHQLGPDKGMQLQKLVDRFNETEGKGNKVVIVDRPLAQGGLPHMMILSERDEERFRADGKQYRPLWQVMKEAGEPLKTLAVPKYMVPGVLDASNRPLALPVALSTPVVFFNKEVLRKAGIASGDIPKTWQGWQGLLGKLQQDGSPCPFTVSDPVSVLLENASAWNNQAFVTGGKNEQLAANGLIQVKHLAMMATWFKSGYLRYFGRSSEGEDRFLKGECAVVAAPSGAYPALVRQAAFEVGVASYPYHEDAYGAPQNTWADGPALWVASGKTPAEYRLVARFIRYWLTPESQVEWQVNAGYLPLNPAGVLAATGSVLLKDEFAAQRIAIAQLTNKLPTAVSVATAFGHRKGVRQVLAEEMEEVFADRKPAKQGLDDAVRRVREGGVECCRPLRQGESSGR